MTLDQYLALQRSRLSRFGYFWRRGQRGNETVFTTDRNVTEWDEAVAFFDQLDRGPKGTRAAEPAPRVNGPVSETC